jgi:protein LTV1
LADLDASIDKSKMRPNEGEAALYGITYDDSSYDYMAHLRPIQGGFDSFMIPAPRGSGVAKGMKGDRKGKSKELFVADDYLASREEVPLAEVYGREENIPRELQGLQPDMDPHLRQVLEALEDDAFIDEQAEEEGEGDEGEWWGELIAGGEADEYEREEFEFEEWGVDQGGKSGKVPDLVEREDKEETWEDRFRAFKQAQRDGAAGGPGSEAAIERSEMADTLGSMVSGMEDLMVRGGKKRRGKRGPSDASGMSMSSSSMFRTQGLRDLDARFDKASLPCFARLV